MPELKSYRLFFKEGLEVDVRAAGAAFDQPRRQVRFTGEDGTFIDDMIIVVDQLQAIIPVAQISESAASSNGVD